MSFKQKRFKSVRRRTDIEHLGARIPLAGDIHNFIEPGDVNGDGDTRASDALVIINLLARSDSNGTVEGESTGDAIRKVFPDVNDDDSIAPLDALLVINELARDVSSVSTESAKETLEGESGIRARVELELKGSGRAELEIRVAGASPNVSLDVSVDGVLLGQVSVNDQGRGELELKYSPETTEVPQVLRDATVDSTISIGDSLVGTIGSLGELEMSDGGSDGISDGASDANSDGSPDSASDAMSDADSDGESDALSDATSDGASDDDADSSSSSSSSSSLGSTGSDGSADGGSDGDSDAFSDGSSDGLSDGLSDSLSDGGSD